MALPGLRRVPTDQLHVTLYFIGASSQEQAIRLALAEVRSPPVSLTLQGAGRWPGVLWAGVRQEAALSALQQRVTLALGSCGLEAEARPFRPHITLGRFRARRPPASLDAWLRTQRKLCAPTGHAPEFCLYSSELTPSGARYRILQRFPLRAETRT